MSFWIVWFIPAPEKSREGMWALRHVGLITLVFCEEMKNRGGGGGGMLSAEGCWQLSQDIWESDWKVDDYQGSRGWAHKDHEWLTAR